MQRYYLKANAKLNLYININFKNEINYHDLTMLNIPINLFDTINVEIDENQNDEIKLNVINNVVSNDENNLIYKAVEAFKKIENKKFSYRAKIYKEIPVKSGTGGASSDAAVVIKNLYDHFNIEISTQQLINKYLFLGADIPFFFVNKNAIVNGIGEKIQEIDLNLKRYYFVLIHPDFNESTSEIYQKLDKIEKKLDDNGVEKAINLIKSERNFELLKNDFTKVVGNKKYDKIINVLYSHGAKYSNITGTGSTVYAIFEKQINAKNLNNELQKTYKNVFICQNMGD